MAVASELRKDKKLVEIVKTAMVIGTVGTLQIPIDMTLGIRMNLGLRVIGPDTTVMPLRIDRLVVTVTVELR